MRRSLLNLRDPSIIAYNLASVQPHLQPCDKEETRSYLHVYLRIKGGVENYNDLYEVTESGSLIAKLPEGSHQARNIKPGDLVKRIYDFSKIFGPETQQWHIFNELMKPKLLKFMNGENCTLMTYGVSSSGKTYTVIGTSQEPGVLPRSLEYLFNTIPGLSDKPKIKPTSNGQIIRLTEEEMQKEVKLKEDIINYAWPNVENFELVNSYRTMQSRLSEEPIAETDDIPNLSVAVWVSYVEIYNEHIHDLLSPSSANGKTKEKLKLGSSNGFHYIKNLRTVHVSNSLEAFQVMQYGLQHLNYAKTKINDHSSRSHSIFTIRLAQALDHNEEEFCISQFNFCDLAGAERSKKTMNVGDRLKESNNINTSLMVLGRCIAGVRNAQKASNVSKLIPFRESKLTQLFQNALSGQEDISMVVNMNPCRELFDETQHVLNFSAIAKNVVVELKPKNVVKSNKIVHGRRTEVFKEELGQHKSVEFLEKERKLQVLENRISECLQFLEMEEQDLQEEIEAARGKIMADYVNKLECRSQELDDDYHALDLALTRENRRRLKERKRRRMDDFKNNESLSFSSESSDDESDLLSFDTSMYSRKRKADTDLETITVLSSDEEEDVQFWKKKVESQQKTLEELRNTQRKLDDEMNAIREKIHRIEQRTN